MAWQFHADSSLPSCPVAQAFRDEAIVLEPAVERAVEDDLSPDAIGGQHYVRRLEQWAKTHAHAATVSEGLTFNLPQHYALT